MQDRTTRSWDLGRLVIATLVVACLAMAATILWRRLGPHDRLREASVVVAPESERLAEPPASALPAQPRSEESVGERERSTEGTSRPDGETRATQRVEGGLRDSRPAPPPTGIRGLPADVQLLDPGGPDSTGANSALRSAPAPPLVTAAQGTSRPVSHGVDLQVGGPTVSSFGLQSSGVAVPRESPTPPKAEAATPEESPTPEPSEPAEVAPGSDRTPPVLEMMRFDPPVVEGGNVTMLTIEARDDLSGVKSARGEIQSPSGLATLPIWPQESAGGNTFTFALTIPRDAETGVWYVKWIYLTDVANNSSLIQAFSAGTAPPGGTFSVSSSKSDSIAPEVLRVWFDKATVGDGGDNVIKVEARDDSSGIDSIVGACQNPSRSALVWFKCALNPGSGVWEGEVVVPDNADCGEWVVQQISAKDRAGNTTLLMNDSPLLARASFRIPPRADCDSTPPTLDAFELTPTIVSSAAATEILVTAAVNDAGSGAVAMTGWFEGPVSEGGQIPKNHFRCVPDPDHPEAPWTGTIEVPQFAAKGIWKVGVIRLEDRALNFREYTSADPIVSGHVFEVQ